MTKIDYIFSIAMGLCLVAFAIVVIVVERFDKFYGD